MQKLKKLKQYYNKQYTHSRKANCELSTNPDYTVASDDALWDRTLIGQVS